MHERVHACQSPLKRCGFCLMASLWCRAAATHTQTQTHTDTQTHRHTDTHTTSAVQSASTCLSRGGRVTWHSLHVQHSRGCPSGFSGFWPEEGELSSLLQPAHNYCVLRNTYSHNHSVDSTHKGVNQRSKYVTQVQQQRPESPTVTLTWHACKY